MPVRPSSSPEGLSRRRSLATTGASFIAGLAAVAAVLFNLAMRAARLSVGPVCGVVHS